MWGGEFGNADELYKQGIGMSFQENGVTASVDDYMNSGNVPIKHEFGGSYSCSFSAPRAVTVKFEGSREEKLEKIIIQKWLALFPNGQEAWTEWRRTGYPDLSHYPTSFHQTTEDEANYQAILKLLNNGKGGEDKSSTRLWWDCK